MLYSPNTLHYTIQLMTTYYNGSSFVLISLRTFCVVQFIFTLLSHFWFAVKTLRTNLSTLGLSTSLYSCSVWLTILSAVIAVLNHKCQSNKSSVRTQGKEIFDSLTEN